MTVPRSTRLDTVVRAIGLVGLIALLASVVYVGHGLVGTARASTVGPLPAPAQAPPPAVVHPAVPLTLTFRVDGTAPRARVDDSLDGVAGGGTEVRVPWTARLTSKEVGLHSSSVFAYGVPGAPGDLTCTILDQDGRVLARSTVGSPSGTAGVYCVL